MSTQPRPRQKILPKNRTLPYRVLALLLYSRYPWIARRPSDDGLSVEVRFIATPFRRALGVTNRKRLYEYLAWLDARRLVSDVRTDVAGRVECRVPRIGVWNEWDFPGWALRRRSRSPLDRPTVMYETYVRESADLLTERRTMAGELVAPLPEGEDVE